MLTLLVVTLEALPYLLFPVALVVTKRKGTYNNIAVLVSIASCLVAVALDLFYR